MARKATGQVIEREGSRGKTFALRFRAYGERRFLTLGRADEGWTRQKAELELENVLADVRRGIWQPPDPEPVVEEPRPDPTFHEFSSEWLEARRHELGERTVEDYTWALSVHLLPFFAHYRVGAITIEDVGRYRSAKVREGRLGARSINKTITRLSQVLQAAVEYGYLDSNPATGRRRRLKADAPRRRFLEPEQVRALLDAAGKHRTLLATAIMAGGLRVSEVAGLRWRDVDLASGRLASPRPRPRPVSGRLISRRTFGRSSPPTRRPRPSRGRGTSCSRPGRARGATAARFAGESFDRRPRERTGRSRSKG